MYNTVDTSEERNEFLGINIDLLDAALENLESDDDKDYEDALYEALNSLKEFKIKFDNFYEEAEIEDSYELNQQYGEHDNVVESIENLSVNCESEEEFIEVINKAKSTLAKMID